MHPPREQGGGLAEASRLLQEGLQLLDERQREVDRMLEDARERALVIQEEAEAHAQQITAEAEQQRAELEEQVAALRSEVASLREELAQLRAAPPPPPPPIEAPPDDAPRWGRQSNGPLLSQATRARSGRPRWLPPWLPFLLVLLVAAAVVATNVDGQSPRTAVDELQPTVSALDPTMRAQEISASATLSAPLDSATPTRVVVVNTAAPTSTPTSLPSLSPTSVPLTLPPSGARITTPVAVPAPVVAAYTRYTSYTVQPGDTLNRVATQFGVSGDTIVRTSGLDDPNLLQPGQILTIPRESGWLYQAQAGDTLDIIALRFGLTSDDLNQANPSLGGTVMIGDLVFVPDRGTAPKR